MRHLRASVGTLAACLLCIAMANGQDDEATKKEMKVLEGTWLATSGEQNGMATDKFNGDKLIIGEGKFTVYHEVNAVIKAKLKVDAGKKPKTIDVTISEGNESGKTALGIYELSGDVLKFCFEKPGGTDRPTEFKTKEGTERMMVVLKKQS